MRRISSCNDLRAWSLSDEDRRQYFLDTVRSGSPSFGKFIPPDVIVDIIKKQNRSYVKKIGLLRRSSSDDSLKKRGKPVRKRSGIDSASFKDNDQQVDLERETDDLESDNLRDVVKRLEDKLSDMKRLEEENSKLKTRINHGINRMSNTEGSNALVSKKDFLTDAAAGRCEQLSLAIDLVGTKCDGMLSDVDRLRSKNFELTKKLMERTDKEKAFTEREFSVSLESVNNAVLKNKVLSKNVKIEKLVSTNEALKFQIADLSMKIKDMATRFAWREEMLVGKLNEFKNMAQSSYDKSLRFMNKLVLCQTVIKEMDILGDHFRKVNAVLEDSSQFYRNRLGSVAYKAIEMAGKVEILLKEVAKRDAKIKELSGFPGRTALAVRLAQLDEIVNSDFLFQKGNTDVVETYGRMKRILHRLKTEAYDEYGFEHALSVCDRSDQTSIEHRDSTVQFDPDVADVSTQTEFPDSYIERFLIYTVCVNMFNSVVEKLKRSASIEVDKNNALEMRMSDLQVTLSEKSNDITSLSNENSSLLDTINSLESSLLEERSMNSLIVERTELVIYAVESVNSLMNDSSVFAYEYFNSYSDLLEFIAESNERKTRERIEFLERELHTQSWQHISDMSELEEKNSLLERSLANEIDINRILSNEVDRLVADLVDRDYVLNKIGELWHNIGFFNENLSESVATAKEFSDSSVQISLDIFETEVTTDTDIFPVTRAMSNRIIEADLTDSNPGRKSRIKNFYVDSSLRKKITRVNIKVKRVRNRIINLKNKLDLSIETLNKMKESNNWLSEISRNMSTENSALKKKNGRLRRVISSLRNFIRTELSKNESLRDYRIKIADDRQRIESEAVPSDKVFTEKSINTDLVMFDFRRSMESKDLCIGQLKDRIEKLLDLLKDIEEEKKMKESGLVSKHCQCDIETDSEEKRLIDIADLKNNYDAIIERLKEEHSAQKEATEKYFRNNLSILKDTYERDIKRIRAANADSLRKIQSFHQEEIRAIKLYRDENETKTQSVDINSDREKHAKEMEQLRIDYERMMKEKSDRFVREKECLQEEMKKYMDEKERQVEEISERMEEGIKNMKKKCKKHMKKLQKENSYALEEMKKQYSDAKTDEMLSCDTSCDTYSLPLDKDCSVNGSSDTNCNKDGSETYVEMKTDASSFDDDLYDCETTDERRFFTRRIRQLEEQLAEKRKESSENACDSEKRVWVERERCRELSKHLEREIQSNEKLWTKFKDEKARAEHLAVVNRALLEKIGNMESSNYEKDVDTYSILNKEPYSHNKHSAMFDSYEYSLKSDLINPCELTTDMYR